MNRAIILALLLATAACSPAGPGNGGQDSSQAAAAGAGIVAASMDRAVAPGDDFFAYANGSWVRNTAIPDDRSSIGGFYIADQERERQTRELLTGILGSKPAAGSNEALVADYYNAFLNTDSIDRAGLGPAKADLDSIAAIADKRQLSAAIGGTLRADTDPLNATNYQTENLFGIFVTQGLATPGETLPYLMQGGIGLPEREYYLSGDGKMAGLRDQYRAYIATIMKAAGAADSEAAAGRILDLETKIARAHATREESEDFAKGATVWSRAELESKAPGIDWPSLLGAAQLGGARKFQAYHAGAIPKLAALVGSEPLQNWKEWLAFHTLNQQANVLPKPIRDASFAFNGTALSGAKKQRPRDQLALNAVSNALQDAVGKAYVDRYFPASAKAEVQKMVENIKAAFARRVEAIDWMAPSTKEEALRKVRSIVVGVGYPDNWRNYSALRIVPDNAYANQKNAGLAEYRHQISKIGKPMDRNEWWMPPQLVNAVNLPVQNALNFPAAIIQRPFFDPRADAALARQYDSYEALPGLRVNGKLTLGENIADVAGVAAAYDAYRASLGGKEAPVIEGFTGDQRFFIAYGQAWASKMLEPTLRQRVLTDGHAPGQFRALTVRNLDAWYDAFNVQPNQKLYLAPEKRVKVW
jgi:predicted metalloendopeptidase